MKLIVNLLIFLLILSSCDKDEEVITVAIGNDIQLLKVIQLMM